jgi:hypothetical protein
MIEAAATEREAFEAWAADMEKKSGGPIPRLERALLQEGWQARAALSQQAAPAEPVAQSGWLIEHSGKLTDEFQGQISWLCVKFKFEGHGAREFGYTHDSNKALRFSRKEDAEAVMAMHLGASPPKWYSAPYSVTEHQWIDTTPPAPEAQP